MTGHNLRALLCPTTNRRSYRSEEQAQRMIPRASAGRLKKPERVYRCWYCGTWHLTSVPLVDWAADLEIPIGRAVEYQVDRWMEPRVLRRRFRRPGSWAPHGRTKADPSSLFCGFGLRTDRGLILAVMQIPGMSPANRAWCVNYVANIVADLEDRDRPNWVQWCRMPVTSSAGLELFDFYPIGQWKVRIV